MNELFYIKMKLHIIQELNNCGLPPQIYFNPNPIIRNKLNKKHYSPKVNIKTQPGEANSKMVSLYVPIFNTSLD